MYCTTQLMLLGLACLLCTLWPAHGLSYPLCTSYGSSWVTDSPHLTGQFPYYDLIFSCRGCAPAWPELAGLLTLLGSWHC